MAEPHLTGVDFNAIAISYLHHYRLQILSAMYMMVAA
jgi:hypothetical protein